MSTIKANTLLHSDGTTTTQPSIPALDQRMAKAWVTFNSSGTVAIRDSEGVSSISDNGTGDYAINFAVAMVNVNYVATLAAQNINGTNDGNTVIASHHKGTSRSTSSYPLFVGGWLIGGYTGAGKDSSDVNIIVMGGQA